MQSAMDEVSVGGLTAARVATLLTDGRPVILRSPSADGPKAELMNWEQFIAAVAAGVYPSSRLRVTHKDGQKVPKVFYSNSEGVDLDRINNVLNNGGSLVAYGVENYFPAIKRACDVLRGELDEHVEAGVIATTGAGGALKVHFDPTDLLALQLEGSKHWTAYREPVPNLARAQIDEPSIPSLSDPKAIDEALKPGDALFLPAGHWHHCDNVEGRSLHVVFLFFPLSEERVLTLLERDALASAPRNGARPIGVTRQARVEALKARLLERIKAISAEELFGAHLQEFADARPLKKAASEREPAA